MSQPTHDPELTAVERALAGLAPSAGALDRDGLMFAAGRRSARPGWAWRGAAVASTLAAAVLGALVLLRPEPEPVVRIEYRVVPGPHEVAPLPTAPEEVAPPRTPSSPQPETNYLTLRQQVERWGDAGLPAPRTARTPDERPAAEDPLDWRADPCLQRRKTLPTPGGIP
jgi:hypothetical protein